LSAACDGLIVVGFGADVVLCADFGHTILFRVLTLDAPETRVRSIVNDPQPSIWNSTIHKRYLASIIEHQFGAELDLEPDGKKLPHHARKR
jgi:hypothetical protein